MKIRVDLKNIHLPDKKTYRIRGIIAGIVFGIICLFALCVIAILAVAQLYDVSMQMLQHPVLIGLFLVLFSVGIACVIYSIIFRSTLKHLERLSSASQQIARGDFSTRLDYSGAVTELHSTILSFNHMARELQSVEMMRNDFIANVSHEFKTPLSSVNGYVMLLQDPDLPEDERQENIEKIFLNIERLNDLTDNILRLSRLENQQYMDDPTPFALDEQLREAVVMLEQKWSKKQLELDIELEEVQYTGQQSLLLQVWLNLIGNAIKFTEPGGKICVHLHTTSASAEVTISDNGIGMDKETISHIFDKFYQGDTSRRSQGNGLGLAICREILNQCGGEISVYSDPGAGTVFTVKLPR